MNIIVCLIGYILSEEVFECNCNIYSKECEEYCPFTKSSYINLVKQKSNSLINFEDKVYDSCKLRDWYDSVNYINIVRASDKNLYNYLKSNPIVFNKCNKLGNIYVKNNTNVLSRVNNAKTLQNTQGKNVVINQNKYIDKNNNREYHKNQIIDINNNQNENVINNQNRQSEINHSQDINAILSTQNKNVVLNSQNKLLQNDKINFSSIIYQDKVNNRQIDLPDQNINLLITKKHTPYLVDNYTTISSDMINPLIFYEKEKPKPSKLQISVITKTSTVHSTTTRKITKKTNDKKDISNYTQNKTFTDLLKEIKNLKIQTITNTILKRELITTTKNYFIWDDTNPSTVLVTTTVYKINNQDNLSGSTIHFTQTEYITKTYTSSLSYTTFTITSTSTEYTTLKRNTTDKIYNRSKNVKKTKEDNKIISSIYLPYKNKENDVNNIANNALLKNDKNNVEIKKDGNEKINNAQSLDISITKDIQPSITVDQNISLMSDIINSSISNNNGTFKLSKNYNTVSDIDNDISPSINSSFTSINSNSASISDNDRIITPDKNISTIKSDNVKNNTVISDNSNNNSSIIPKFSTAMPDNFNNNTVISDNNNSTIKSGNFNNSTVIPDNNNSTIKSGNFNNSTVIPDNFNNSTVIPDNYTNSTVGTSSSMSELLSTSKQSIALDKSNEKDTASFGLEKSLTSDNNSTVKHKCINTSASYCNSKNNLIIKIKKKKQSTKTETVTSNYTLSPEVVYKTVTEYVYKNSDDKNPGELISSTVNIEEKDNLNNTESIKPTVNLERFKTVVTSYLYIS